MSTPIYEIYLYEAAVTSLPFELGKAQIGYCTFGSAATDAKPIAILTKWDYLEFHLRVNAPGYHMIRFHLGEKDPMLGILRSYVDVDTIINIYRTDINTGERRRVYEAFNRTTVEQKLSDGSVQFTIYGRGFLDLLNRRIVIPPTGMDSLDKSGPAETVMKEYVEETAVSPSDPTRYIPGLVVEPDKGEGGYVTYSARYTQLDTVIDNLAKQGFVDYGIVQVGENIGNFRFEVRRPWGTDRRVGNLVGNTPLLFDELSGNMYVPNLSKNTSEEITYIYVGGQGEGKDRTIVEMSIPPRVSASPWNRIERFVDARNQPSTTGLYTVGQDRLQEARYRPQLNFSPKQIRGARWLQDWNLGDLITARYAGVRVDKQIVEISVIVGSGEGRSQTEWVDIVTKDVVSFWVLGVSGYSELSETTIFG